MLNACLGLSPGFFCAKTLGPHRRWPASFTTTTAQKNVESRDSSAGQHPQGPAPRLEVPWKNRDKSRHFATDRKYENTLTREKTRAPRTLVGQSISRQGFNPAPGRNGDERINLSQRQADSSVGTVGLTAKR